MVSITNIFNFLRGIIIFSPQFYLSMLKVYFKPFDILSKIKKKSLVDSLIVSVFLSCFHSIGFLPFLFHGFRLESFLGLLVFTAVFCFYFFRLWIQMNIIYFLGKKLGGTGRKFDVFWAILLVNIFDSILAKIIYQIRPYFFQANWLFIITGTYLLYLTYLAIKIIHKTTPFRSIVVIAGFIIVQVTYTLLAYELLKIILKLNLVRII